MDLKIIDCFLKDEDPQVRGASLKILADSSEEKAEILLLHAFEDPVESVRSAAKEVMVYRYPWLLLRPFTARKVPEEAFDSPWGNAWRSLRYAIKQFIHKKDKDLDFKVLKRFLPLPGMIPDIMEELEFASKTELALELGRQSALYDDIQENQLLFVPTYSCNLSCCYCYAKGMNLIFKRDISLENMEVMFSWAKRQDINLLVLAGGEPTVYNDFGLLLSMAREKGIRVHLTTNGLYSKKLRPFIQPEYIKTLIVHYDQSLIENQNCHQRFVDNLSEAKSRGVNLRFRYTLTEKSNPAEWEHILNIVSMFDIPTLDYACAFKNYLGNNDAFEDFFSLNGGTFEDKFLSFVEASFAREIKLHLCKPIPLCSFSDTTLRYLMMKGVLRTACGAYYRNFTNNLTVNPDLSTFPCNAILAHGPSIKSFETLSDAGDHYSGLIKQLLFFPYYPKCKKCLLFYRGFCQGSCLADKYSMIVAKGETGVLQSTSSHK